MDDARALIDRLNLAPHPEGGWFRETVRLPGPPGARDAMTAILFLLAGGERSHWHRVDAAELWLWHAGAPLDLLVAGERGVERATLDGARPQWLVPPHAWQSAAARGGWALVSCVVTPGFRFEGFELAPPGWSPDEKLSAPGPPQSRADVSFCAK